MTDQPVVHLTSPGFARHGCAFCGAAIPVDSPDQFPLVIQLAGRSTRLWSHRDCLGRRVTDTVRTMLDRLPPATPSDVWPPQPA